MIPTHLVLLIVVTSNGPFNICIYSSSMTLDVTYPGSQVGKFTVDLWPNGS